MFEQSLFALPYHVEEMGRLQKIPSRMPTSSTSLPIGILIFS